MEWIVVVLMMGIVVIGQIVIIWLMIIDRGRKDKETVGTNNEPGWVVTAESRSYGQGDK